MNIAFHCVSSLLSHRSGAIQGLRVWISLRERLRGTGRDIQITLQTSKRKGEKGSITGWNVTTTDKENQKGDLEHFTGLCFKS